MENENTTAKTGSKYFFENNWNKKPVTNPTIIPPTTTWTNSIPASPIERCAKSR
jgi:hypothetical protein